MTRCWKLFLAYFRLSKSAVCEMSVGRDKYHDFHDYSDSEWGEPWHFCNLICKRCGKEFCI
jgi:hypothetical protein